MKRSILAVFLAAITLVGVVFLAAPEAKATGEHPHGEGTSHCVCAGADAGAVAKDPNHSCSNPITNWTPVSSESDFVVDGVITPGTYYLTDSFTFTAAVDITGTVTICLNGHTITTAGVANAIEVAGGTLNLCDCSSTQGAVVTPGAAATNVIRLTSGTLNIYGGTYTQVSENSNKSNYVATTGSGAVFNIYGGTFSRNGASTGYGAVFQLYTNTVFTMYGGTIHAGEAGNANGGGGIAAIKSVTVNLLGGSITGGSATNASGKGGNISLTVATSTLTIGNDFVCTGGTAATGGDIYCAGTVNISGAPTIGEIYVPSGKTINVTSALTGGSIGVTAEDLTAAIATVPADDTTSVTYFKPSATATTAGYLSVVQDGTSLKLSTEAPAHRHCLCTVGTGAHAGCNGHALTTWTPIATWAELTSAINQLQVGEEGSYCLSEDIVYTSRINIKSGRTVNICLNGHTCTSNSRVFLVAGELNITDCLGTGAIEISGNADILRTYGGADVNLYAGNFTSTSTNRHFWLDSAASSTLQAEAGPASMTVYGGNISQTVPLASGYGGLFSATKSDITLNICGGNLSGVGLVNPDSTSAYGGLIYIRTATLNISGGTISGGNAYYGGSICVASGNLNITGGTIQEGSANYGGNLAILDASSVSVANATFSYGSAINRGGNVYTALNIAHTFDSVIFSYGEASEGGNVFVNGQANVTFADCSIENGSATDNSGYAGGIDTLSHGSIILTGTTSFSNNTNGDLCVRIGDGQLSQYSISGLSGTAIISVNTDSTASSGVFTADNNNNITFTPATAGKAAVSKNEATGLWTITGCRPMFSIGENEYYTIADLAAALTEGTIVTLESSDLSGELEIAVDIVLDVNGKRPENFTIVLGQGVTLSAFDSTTNTYSDARVGMVAIDTSAAGAAVAPVTTITTPAAHKYLAVKEGNLYSFHRFYLAMTHKDISTENAGFGIKATFAGTNTLIDMMKDESGNNTFGIAFGTTQGFALNTQKILRDGTDGDFAADNTYTACYYIDNVFAPGYNSNWEVLDAETGTLRAVTASDFTELFGMLNNTTYFRAYINFSNNVVVESNAEAYVNPQDTLEDFNDKFAADWASPSTNNDNYTGELRFNVCKMLANISDKCTALNITNALSAYTSDIMGEVEKLSANHTTGTNVAQPLTRVELEGLPIASADMTEDELRQLVVDFMRMQNSLAWETNEAFSFIKNKNNVELTIPTNKVYGGCPYLSLQYGTLYNFMNYYNDETGILDFITLNQHAQNWDEIIANVCSSSVIWAWRRVSNSFDSGSTSTFVPAKGCIPVGDYANITLVGQVDGVTYNYMDILTLDSSGKYYFSTRDITEHPDNGADKMYEAYALMKPADGLIYLKFAEEDGVWVNKGGHVIMVTSCTVVRNSNTGKIDPDLSKITFTDQAQSPDKNIIMQDNGIGKHTFGHQDNELTFRNLFETKAALPFTFKEFRGEDPVEMSEISYGMTENAGKANQTITPVDGTITVDELLDKKMMVHSNYALSYLQFIVKDSTGNTAYNEWAYPQKQLLDDAYRMNAWFIYRERNLETGETTISEERVALDEAALDALADGNHTIEIYAQLSNGEVLTAYTGTLVAGTN